MPTSYLFKQSKGLHSNRQARMLTGETIKSDYL